MSLRERDRITVLREVAEGLIRPQAAARKLGLSARHFRRLRRRFEQEGDGVVIHRLRGQPGNHHLPLDLRARLIERAEEPVFHDFGPTLLAEHLSRDSSLGEIKPDTLRRWLIQTGRWSVAPRKLRHRRKRERRAAFGELIQMDTSIHPWLEDRSESPIVLIAMIDDATSRLKARFAESDSGSENRSLIISYLERFGRMRALYTDRASHFSSQTKERASLDLPPLSSTISRSLAALDIELITALSPQAKGRVERLFGTLQDRLLKELRVAGISTLREANRFLEETFTPFWNRTYTTEPRERADAHRPLPEGTDLQDIFAERQSRRINPDFTLRFQNTYYQISHDEAKPAMPGTRVEISRRLDGKLSFRWKGENLRPTALPSLRKSPIKPKSNSKARHSTKPAKNHPWRTSNMLFAVKH